MTDLHSPRPFCLRTGRIDDGQRQKTGRPPAIEGTVNHFGAAAVISARANIMASGEPDVTDSPVCVPFGTFTHDLHWISLTWFKSARCDQRGPRCEIHGRVLDPSLRRYSTAPASRLFWSTARYAKNVTRPRKTDVSDASWLQAAGISVMVSFLRRQLFDQNS